MDYSAKEIAKVRRDREDMIDTYIQAIRRVGGSPQTFLEDIDKMTVAEMIDRLAQNGVRFTTNR